MNEQASRTKNSINIPSVDYSNSHLNSGISLQEMTTFVCDCESCTKSGDHCDGTCGECLGCIYQHLDKDRW